MSKAVRILLGIKQPNPEQAPTMATDPPGMSDFKAKAAELTANMSEEQLAEKVDRAKEKEEETKLSPKVAIMKPILRFLQLLCENHNRDLQNLLRDQRANKVGNVISR